MSELFKFLTSLLNFFSLLVPGGIVHVAQKVHKIYDLLNKVVDDEELGISRMTILRIHNGGGNLSSSKATYASIVYEEFRKPLHSVRDKYQSWPADRHYMGILQELHLQGDLVMDIATLAEGNFRTSMLTQGIRKCRYFFLKETRGGFLWLRTKELHIASVVTLDPEVSLKEIQTQESLTQIISDIKRLL